MAVSLTSHISKKEMSEEDIKKRFVSPALADAGWENDLILMERYFTDGRILVPGKGKLHAKKKGNKADYILFAEPNLPIAIVEAKDNNQPVSGGIQQAIHYAEILDLPFAFSSNGDGFCEFDRTTGNQRSDIPLDGFPTPAELHKRYWDSRNLKPSERAVVDTPYHYDMETYPPRYYQRIAINRTVEAVAKGAKRLLLVMATGTGKTYTAFQVIHRLHRSGLKKKILYLADRNILIDQTIAQDFKPFKKVMAKVQQKSVDSSFEIYMSLYGQWVEYDRNSQKSDAEIDVSKTKQPYESLAPDFFDLIIVDECHRGSVRDDSEWKRILEYFSSATQIGMTATPKSIEGADNLGYFCNETNGKPLYVYSLKQGIDDGFLAPYRVTQSFIDIDLEGWKPEPDEKDIYDYLIEQRLYNRADMGRKLAVNVRRQIVARRITKMLHDIGRRTKTIVFCPDQEEALEMRNLLAELNPDECKKDSRYVMRITSDDMVGKKQLDNFIDPDEPYPTIVTTSELLETGVDCKTCGLIVFDKEVESMTKFKQMVGRGTRINAAKGKFFFDILDFRNVTSKFADPEFDGIADVRGTVRYDDDEDETLLPDGPQDEQNPCYTPAKFHIDGPADCKIVHEVVKILGADGKLTTMSVKDYTRKAVLRQFASLDDFIGKWSQAERKKAVLDELEKADMPLMIEQVQSENPNLADKDAFDVILHLAFDQRPLTRRERAENVKKRNYLAKYEGKARQILEALLDKYADGGVLELESENILDIPPFDAIGAPTKLVEFFGGRENFEKAVRELENELYGKVA